MLGPAEEAERANDLEANSAGCPSPLPLINGNMLNAFRQSEFNHRRLAEIETDQAHLAWLGSPRDDLEPGCVHRRMAYLLAGGELRSHFGRGAEPKR